MSNLNLNKVILGGRLTAEPELKTTTSGVSVATFTIAVNRRYSKEEQIADFINCVAWRQTAEFICRYFHKGSSICVSGEIQTRKWTNENGENRYATEVIVGEALFVDSKNENGTAPNMAPPVADGGNDVEFEEVTDDELPF